MKKIRITWYDLTFMGGWVAITAGLAQTWRGWVVSMGALIALYSVVAGIHAAFFTD